MGRSENTPLDCCAIYGLEDFPYDDDMKYDNVRDKEFQFRLFRENLKYHIRRCKELGKSMLMASVNTEQLEAAVILEEKGFKTMGWAVRPAAGSGYKTKVAVYIKFIRQPSKDIASKVSKMRSHN